VLLGIFMAAMCLGSLTLPRVIAAGRHPLRVYAALELGIGVIGVLVLVAMPVIGGVYTAWAGPGISGVILRGRRLRSACCRRRFSWRDPARGVPLASRPRPEACPGSVFSNRRTPAACNRGSLLAGFTCSGSYVTRGTLTAVAINIGVAVLAFVVAARAPDEPPARSTRSGRAGPDAWMVYLAIAVSA